MKRLGILLVMVAVMMTGCIVIPAGGHRGYYEPHYDRGSQGYDRGYRGYDRDHYGR